MIKSILKYKNHFWLLVAFTVAFALRMYALSAQSLWNDEGTSVALSQLSLEAIINGAARDIHPPLYYYLLHFWMPLAGQSEFAVRFLSVIAGVLTVAFTARIAYVFFDKEIALFAAYLSAFSAFQVYYSQEARMYIWVTLFAVMSVYAMTMMLKRLDRRPLTVDGDLPVIENRKSKIENKNSRTKRTLYWLMYIVATIAMLYTQYIGAFVVVAENLAFVVWLVMAWRDQRPNILHSVAFWLAAQIIVGLAFLPWYAFAGGQLASWPAISDAIDLPTLLWRVLNVFSTGITLDSGTAAGVAIAFAILFFVGWRRVTDATVNWLTVSLILWTLVPIAVMYIVSLSRPAYNPKFLLLATPAFFILAARGLAQFKFRNSQFAIRNSLVVIGAVIVVAGNLQSLNNYYFNPQYARDDYRAIAQFIDAHARDGDGILIDAPGQIDVVRYYLRGNPQLFLLPRIRPPEPNATRADVDEMLGKTKRLFAIYYATQQSDPQSIIENRLAERAFKASDEWHGNVRLAIYGVAPNARAIPGKIVEDVGSEITLLNYQLDQREARAGDVLTLTLNWRANQTPSTRYKVFVHLLDANRQVVAQRDGEPVSDTRITTTWQPGEMIADNYGVFIDPGTRPGTYEIEIGMYRAEDGTRLPIGPSDHYMLGEVRVH